MRGGVSSHVAFKLTLPVRMGHPLPESLPDFASRTGGLFGKNVHS